MFGLMETLLFAGDLQWQPGQMLQCCESAVLEPPRLSALGFDHHPAKTHLSYRLRSRIDRFWQRELVNGVLR
jgi:hypothetical protein